MSRVAAFSTIEALTSIWRRVLQCPIIPVDGNFFDLGGDSSSAQELFIEIAQIFSRELSPATICYAPTISALAPILEQPSVKRLPPLVLLKSGVADFEGPPVFITHGIGGSVLDLVKLVREIRAPQPIYGMQVRGMDGIEEPFDRIEDMAQWFLDALREVQSRGPYTLIGYSLGGLVTLEMAQRLHTNRENVASLAMLDSYPDIHILSSGQRAFLALRRGRIRLKALLRSALNRNPLTTSNSETGFRSLLGGLSIIRAVEKTRRSSYVALRGYEPRFYDGKIKFVRAKISTFFPDNPVGVWSHLADKFEVETIPGNHLEMLTTNSERLASVLSRYLEEAASG